MRTPTTSRVFSAELEGVDARLVEVEVDINVGISSFTIVGLADKAVSEARERVSSALKNSHIKPPTRQNRRVTVNLAPADVKKNGSHYDVAIALGYLIASGQIGECDISSALFVGELALDGTVRPIPGVVNICQIARAKGFARIFVPRQNIAEAALTEGLEVYGINTLHALIAHLEKKSPIARSPHTPFVPSVKRGSVDMADIKGQFAAKRAMIIAAAGGHNVFMTGSPGAGKTMLAQAMVSILPDMSFEEASEVTRIWSAAGMLEERGYVGARPFRAPHHSASLVSVVGGGQNPRPGEISLAHRGVLFLDEIPEFPRNVLEALRQPLEDGRVVVARAKRTLVFPSRVMLVAASNPCPCGFFQDPTRECTCSAHEIARYQKKLSGPLLDRIDIQLWVEPVTSKDFDIAHQDNSEKIRARINRARERQEARFAEHHIAVHNNAELSSKQSEQTVAITAPARAMLEKALDKGLLSARGFFKTFNVAQTIADLEESDVVGTDAVAEALSYRLRHE